MKGTNALRMVGLRKRLSEEGFAKEEKVHSQLKIIRRTISGIVIMAHDDTTGVAAILSMPFLLAIIPHTLASLQ